ncbi:MAG: uracil-DNA glycosylase family protein [Frisingicoccus sp.]
MQISQAPSRTVHNTGKPFNDASGRRLRSEWYRISDETFYNPDNFYIVSIAHCYLVVSQRRRQPSAKMLC